MHRKLHHFMTFLLLLAVAVFLGVVAVTLHSRGLFVSPAPPTEPTPLRAQDEPPAPADDPAMPSQPGVFIIDVSGSVSQQAPAGDPAQELPQEPENVPAPGVPQGLDVSVHQGQIDWATASAGMSFAFIRAGYRTYGSSGTVLPDPSFAGNLAGAREAGLDVGVYFFSQAITVQEAIEEAQFVLDALDGTPLELPVVLDFEYVSGVNGRLQMAWLSADDATAICKAFCRTIEAAGYTAMIYTNRQLLAWNLNAQELFSEYPLWLSHWTGETDYTGDYAYWQYTSTGTVPGIQGSVDLNARYAMVPEQVQGVQAEPAAAGHVLVTWDKVPGAWGYQVWKQAGGGWSMAAQLVGAASLSWTDAGCDAQQPGTYRVTALLIYEGRTLSGPASASASSRPGAENMYAYLALPEGGRASLEKTEQGWHMTGHGLTDWEGGLLCAARYDADGRQLALDTAPVQDGAVALELSAQAGETLLCVYLLEPDGLTLLSDPWEIPLVQHET